MDIENIIIDLHNEITNLQEKKKEIEMQIKQKIDLMEHFHNQLKATRYASANPQKNWSYNSSNQQKYSNPLWLSKKEIVLKRDGYKCRICGSTATEVHHIDYKDENGNYVKDEIWLSPFSHLISLCSECHAKFKGTNCDDYIFIISEPPMLLSKKRECYRTDLELVNPNWNEVYYKLRYFYMGRDYSQERSLLLIVLNPEATKAGRELLRLQEKEGLNELDKYMLIHRFGGVVNSSINELLNLQEKYPSTKRNCSFIINKISPLIELSKKRPQKGIIHYNSKSKTNGYFITLYDIESRAFVESIDMSNCPEYCRCNNNDYKFFSQFFAIEYVMNRCKETGEKTYDLPIFPNDPNGDLSYIDNKTVLNDISERVKDKNLYIRLKKSIIDKIDFSNFYLYTDWKYNVWGDIPTKQFRGTKIKKHIDLSKVFQ